MVEREIRQVPVGDQALQAPPPLAPPLAPGCGAAEAERTGVITWAVQDGDTNSL